MIKIKSQIEKTYQLHEFSSKNIRFGLRVFVFMCFSISISYFDVLVQGVWELLSKIIKNWVPIWKTTIFLQNFQPRTFVFTLNFLCLYGFELKDAYLRFLFPGGELPPKMIEIRVSKIKKNLSNWWFFNLEHWIWA